MFVNVNSVIVDGLSMGPYLLEAEVQYPKLWGDDTGRNLAGTFSGTFKGVFPKLVLTFRKLNQSEMHLIAPYLDKPFQTTSYYDDNKGTQVTMSTYSGDWGNKSKRIGIAEGVQCNFIATRKRS